MLLLLALQAAADYFGLRINVLTSFEHSCFIEIEPRQPRSSRTLYLSFWAEVRLHAGQGWAVLWAGASFAPAEQGRECAVCDMRM